MSDARSLSVWNTQHLRPSVCYVVTAARRPWDVAVADSQRSHHIALPRPPGVILSHALSPLSSHTLVLAHAPFPSSALRPPAISSTSAGPHPSHMTKWTLDPPVRISWVLKSTRHHTGVQLCTFLSMSVVLLLWILFSGFYNISRCVWQARK